jgi:hypothetical protein
VEALKCVFFSQFFQKKCKVLKKKAFNGFSQKSRDRNYFVGHSVAMEKASLLKFLLFFCEKNISLIP